MRKPIRSAGVVIKNRLKTFQKVLIKFPEFAYLGNPILRKETKRISIKEGARLGQKLGKILVAYRKLVGYGRGLAAPQIGISASVFVTYVNDTVQTYINPKITYRSKKNNFYRELCLSAGLMWGDVKRSENIEMAWTDEMGKSHQEKFDGFMARLLQHEYGHLQGIPNLDEAEK